MLPLQTRLFTKTMPHLRDILPLPIHSYTSLSSQLITITSALGTSASWVGQTIVAEELKGVDGGKGVQKREAKWGSGGNSGVEGNMGKMGKAGNEYGGDAGSPGVVVVSFIHDRKFWAEGLRKLVS